MSKRCGECGKNHARLEWADIAFCAENRLEKALAKIEKMRAVIQAEHALCKQNAKDHKSGRDGELEDFAAFALQRVLNLIDVEDADYAVKS